MRAEVASVLEMHLNRQRQMICQLYPGVAAGRVDLCAGGGTRSKAPHPSPLPEGEGTDRGDRKIVGALKYPVDHKF